MSNCSPAPEPELPPHKVVGITGTNGKSHHDLAGPPHPCNRRRADHPWAATSACRSLAQDPLPGGGVYVLELSSYQIDLTQSLDCEVAVLLNITPDHLDRYEGLRGLCGVEGAIVGDADTAHYALIGTSTEAAERPLVPRTIRTPA